jgi:hypothetical protein
MAKYTKEEYALAKQQKEDLLKLILKKTGTSRKAIVEFAEQEFISANIDMLTQTERRKFDKLVFGK